MNHKSIRIMQVAKMQHARVNIKALACVRNCTHDDLISIKFGSPGKGGGGWNWMRHAHF